MTEEIEIRYGNEVGIRVMSDKKSLEQIAKLVKKLKEEHLPYACLVWSEEDQSDVDVA